MNNLIFEMIFDNILIFCTSSFEFKYVQLIYLTKI